jgi:hypothetical protein
LKIAHDDPIARGTRLFRQDDGEWRDLGVVTSWAYSFVLDTGLVLAFVKRRHQKAGTEFRVGDGPDRDDRADPVRANAVPVTGEFGERPLYAAIPNSAKPRARTRVAFRHERRSSAAPVERARARRRNRRRTAAFALGFAFGVAVSRARASARASRACAPSSANRSPRPAADATSCAACARKSNARRRATRAHSDRDRERERERER